MPSRYLGRYAEVAAALTLIGAGLILILFRQGFRWEYCLLAWFLSVNLVAFGYYGYDKARARKAARRVPETVLHGLAIAGGSLGAYAGMRFFRHKTIKQSFRTVFWWIVFFQVALMAAVVYRILTH